MRSRLEVCAALCCGCDAPLFLVILRRGGGIRFAELCLTAFILLLAL